MDKKTYPRAKARFVAAEECQGFSLGHLEAKRRLQVQNVDCRFTNVAAKASIVVVTYLPCYWGCSRRRVTVVECWRMLPVVVVAVPVTVMV